MPEYQSRILRKKFASDQHILGGWISTTDPVITRVLLNNTFDFLLIDLEHAPINLETLQHILLLFQGQQACPIVRIPWHNREWVKWALDCGAEGILFPNVTTVEEARQAVALCKYPPVGIRGYFPRAAYNFKKDSTDYLSDVNQRILVWIQIEDIQAVSRLDEIFSVEGIDGVLIGPADLSLSMDLLGQKDHPQVRQAVQTIIDSGKKHHIPIGYAADDTTEHVLEVLNQGCRFATVGFDWLLMEQAASARLSEIRQGLKEN